MVAGDEAEPPEHPLCPGKLCREPRDCRAQGELGQSVLPCRTSLRLGENLHVSCGGASAGCPPARGVIPLQDSGFVPKFCFFQL